MAAKKKIKIVGVLTSGGDAPGMNAAVRAVVRTGLDSGLEMVGIRRGYHGLLREDMFSMNSRDVSDIIQRGGTVLQTARSERMRTAPGQKLAAEICEKHGLDALVVIGGDGSYRGALSLAQLGINVIGVPATIDLDIASTEYTIGYDTAVNTAMKAIDIIRDTSTSHERCSIIEVMGRSSGYIALESGMASGAEEILIPEDGEIDVDRIIGNIRAMRTYGKKHYIIVIAEGVGHSLKLAKKIEEETGMAARASILGYLQRGGSPTVRDRVMASMMGAKAIELLLEGKKNRVVAYQKGHFVDFDFEEASKMTKTLPKDMHKIAQAVAV